jgi:hypothetical protein
MDDGNTYAEFEAIATYMTYETNDTINQWNDKSGNDRHLEQSTLTDMPRHSGDSVFFDGVDNYIYYDSGIDTLDQPITVYLVLRAHTHEQYGAFFSSSDANLDPRLAQSSDSTELYLNAGTTAGITATMVYDQLHLMTAVFNGASSTFRIDNDSEETGLDVGAENMSGIRLGSRAALGYYSDVAYFYVIVREGADSSGDQASIRTWLNSEFSIY